MLYGKEAYKGRPNASTTKVMTCILALELAKGDDYVQVSGNAASQPQTRLGMREGQQFYLEDLLYSLMLKSHNDSAVAIAEHIGGSVEGFAEKMNEKAKELGCKDTHFVTPNGLDGDCLLYTSNKDGNASLLTVRGFIAQDKNTGYHYFIGSSREMCIRDRDQEFLKNLKLVITMNDKRLYSGDLLAASLNKAVSLGEFSSGEKGNMRFEVTVPAELDNLYALRARCV